MRAITVELSDLGERADALAVITLDDLRVVEIPASALLQVASEIASHLMQAAEYGPRQSVTLYLAD